MAGYVRSGESLVGNTPTCHEESQEWLETIPIGHEGAHTLPAEYSSAYKALVQGGKVNLLYWSSGTLYPISHTIPMKRKHNKDGSALDQPVPGVGSLCEKNSAVVDVESDTENNVAECSLVGNSCEDGLEEGESIVDVADYDDVDEPGSEMECTSCNRVTTVRGACFCITCGGPMRSRTGTGTTRRKKRTVRRGRDSMRGRLTVERAICWDDYNFSYHSCDRFNWHMAMGRSKHVRRGGSYRAQVDEYLFDCILGNAWVMDANWSYLEGTKCVTLGETDYQKFLQILLQQIVQLIREDKVSLPFSRWL